ncbi:hypothetical protein GCM10009416_28290 [Craurococcus roseus]|uniref:Uncharacterized protein n=1 Tax=Craurococcus roseus TaxID=77585 RepID=A0ABP3QCD8_9PROT
MAAQTLSATAAAKSVTVTRPDPKDRFPPIADESARQLLTADKHDGGSGLASKLTHYPLRSKVAFRPKFL